MEKKGKDSPKIFLNFGVSGNFFGFLDMNNNLPIKKIATIVLLSLLVVYLIDFKSTVYYTRKLYL